MAELKQIDTLIAPSVRCANLTADLTIISGELLPVGCIIAMPQTEVPDTNFWLLCDGSAFPGGSYKGGNTPDLTDDRFLSGGSTYLLSGSNLVTLSDVIYHNHSTIDGTLSSTPSGSSSLTGGSHYHTATDARFPPDGSGQNLGIGGLNYHRTNTLFNYSSYVGNHTHSIADHTHSGTIDLDSSGIGASFSIIPSYFNVRFYIRYK